MKCAIHHQEATAVCVCCGRALCPSCDRVPLSDRTACSNTCAEALSKSERAVDLILSKHVQGARVTAFFLYALGTIFLAVGIVGYRLEPRILMPNAMAGACGIALIVSGIFYHRIAGRHHAKRSNQSMQPTAGRPEANL
jgi:hypothetical protein